MWISSVCLFADFTLSDPPIVSLRLGLELGSDALDEGQFLKYILVQSSSDHHHIGHDHPWISLGGQFGHHSIIMMIIIA